MRAAMNTLMHRRDVIIGAGALAMVACMPDRGSTTENADTPLFKISLAQWSLHKRVFGQPFEVVINEIGWNELSSTLRSDPAKVLKGSMSTLDFPVVARQEFGVEAVEYVNTFFFDKAREDSYLDELRHIAEGEGVTSLLIMCDFEGQLGDPDSELRTQAVVDHSKWADAAAALGCKAIRVNARSAGSAEDQMRLVADGLHELCDYADTVDIDVLVENHGGLSSNGEWVASLMRAVDHQRIGTLPDFGNFNVSETELYDRYKGIAEMMPFARAVSAKSYDFDTEGEETTLDYRRLLRIVVEAGYHGYVGIEYEGTRLSEADGIFATKALLESIRADLESALA